MTMPTIHEATDDDLPGILDIYNDAVSNTTAIFSEQMVTLENRAKWRSDREWAGYPVLVARRNGEVLGYASFGDFRSFPGYRFTVEHSIYVQKQARGQGLGRLLMGELIDAARHAGKRMMVAGVDSQNEGSIQFHENFGFVRTALMPAVGFKFGRWLDLVFLQLDLDPQAK
ncbi:MAG: GNAT family N-acetyltransferase [Hirschia sp.]|nr:GNAT family N-acetyltransferase [Hirschia sp.]MBB35458.1 GNAT family N-acetyltransferase [Hirschia sp.]MBF17592.1 GNAT family N-acetyltransferase [Hirschia sp.]|tara:strand:- start:473 stop:985 length:513 start_codon:yes stop_codon:yes gene_type:complete